MTSQGMTDASAPLRYVGVPPPGWAGLGRVEPTAHRVELDHSDAGRPPAAVAHAEPPCWPLGKRAAVEQPTPDPNRKMCMQRPSVR
jgi:hypothetical protein